MQLFGGGDEFAKKKDIANPNLITGSKDFTGSKWVNIPENVQKDKYLDFTAIYVNWSWQGISQYIAVNKGETFTVSMYVKAHAGSTVSWFINLSDNETNYKKVDTNPSSTMITATGDWQRTSITFTVTGDSGVIKPRLENGSSGGFWIAGMKLERGTNATPWCPAPEDYVMKADSNLNNAYPNVNCDAIGADFDLNMPFIGWRKNVDNLGIPKNAPTGILGTSFYLQMKSNPLDPDTCIEVAIGLGSQAEEGGNKAHPHIWVRQNGWQTWTEWFKVC